MPPSRSTETPLLQAESHYHGHDDVTQYEPGKGDSGPPSQFYVYVCFFCYCLAMVMLGAGINCIGPVTPALAAHVNAKTTDMGPVFTALGLSSVISGIPAGWVVDNVHGHVILFVALATQGVGMIFLSTMPTVLYLSLLFGGVALTFNFSNSTVFTLLVGLFPTAATPLNVASAMFGLGSFSVPIVARFSGYLLNDVLLTFRILGVAACVVSIPFLFLPSPVKPFGSHGDSRPQTRRSSTEYFFLFSVMFLLFLVLSAQIGYSSWIFTYSLDYAKLHPDAAAIVNSAFWAALTAGTVSGAFLSTWLSPATLLLLTVPFAVVGTALPIVVDATVLSPHMLTLAAAVVGFGNSTGYANAFALLNRYTKSTGFINGCMCAVAGLGSMVGPMSVAQLHAHTSLGDQALMWMALVAFIAHFPFIFLVEYLGPQVKGRALKRVESIQLLSDLDFSLRSVASYGDLSTHSAKSDASGPASRFITIVDSL